MNLRKCDIRVQHAYTYNAQNRLTALNVQRSVGVSSAELAERPPASSLDGYAYQLNKNGHSTQITELSGRTIDLTYNPDGHRLTKLISQDGLTQRITTYLTDANNPTGYAFSSKGSAASMQAA